LKELLEELEHPDEHPAESIEDLGDGRWSVPGRLSIRDWSVLFKDRSLIAHPKHVNTLGGLVMVLLDRLPEVGDRVRAGAIEMRVVSMNERAIERIELRVLMPESEAGEGTR
ncbi:MAG: transporter associated domain-containing protein, partial [Phycisphaerales bacterium]